MLNTAIKFVGILLLFSIFEVLIAQPITLEVRVEASSDDAENRYDGVVKYTSKDCELVDDPTSPSGELHQQTVGFRFNGLTIPQGAEISSAYVQFMAGGADDEETTLYFHGEATDNAVTFTTETNNIVNRPITTSMMTWQPVEWTVFGESGVKQKTPDMSSIIQEIVDRSGWVSGNSLVLIVTGSGERKVISWDGDDRYEPPPNGRPTLHIEYSQGDDNLPIELTSFSAEPKSGFVFLHWITESEINNLGFELYRAENEESEYILLTDYKINLELLGQGNSNNKHAYSFADETVKPETTYWYKLADLDYNGLKTLHGPISITTPKAIPKDFKLHSNYPNPFNPSTTIRFDIPATGNLVDTKLIIYNSLGQVVKNLFRKKLNSGSYDAIWNGVTDSGLYAPNGIYFVVFTADGFSRTGRLVLLK